MRILGFFGFAAAAAREDMLRKWREKSMAAIWHEKEEKKNHDLEERKERKERTKEEKRTRIKQRKDLPVKVEELKVEEGRVGWVLRTK